MGSKQIIRELFSVGVMALFLTACGNDGEVLALADPNIENAPLVLPENRPLENNRSFLGKDVFDLDLIYDEGNRSQISYVKRSLLYVDMDTSVITEDLLWDESSLMWNSMVLEKEDTLDLFYQYWNGSSWDRIGINDQTFYKYHDDGTLSFNIQSKEDDTLSYELARWMVQDEQDIAGKSIVIDDMNLTAIMPEGAKRYKIGTGMGQEVLYVINDNNDDAIFDGPSLDHWDPALEDLAQRGFPTFSSLLYASSMHEVSLGVYYKESEVSGVKELIIGDYYATSYQPNSGFGMIQLEGTRYRYNTDGALLEASSLTVEAGSWALGTIKALPVLEVIGYEGELHYFTIVEGMVRFLAVEMPGITSSRDYFNEIAIESMVETLGKTGALEALRALPDF